MTEKQPQNLDAGGKMNRAHYLREGMSEREATERAQFDQEQGLGFGHTLTDAELTDAAQRAGIGDRDPGKLAEMATAAIGYSIDEMAIADAGADRFDVDERAATHHAMTGEEPAQRDPKSDALTRAQQRAQQRQQQAINRPRGPQGLGR